MKDTLKKIKELLELSTENSDKRDLLIGQAMGLIDSLIETPIEPKVNTAPFNVPDAVLKNLETPGTTMMDAVRRHKDVHTELSKDSVTQKNTQFKKL
jgi:hypothetical protein